MKNSNHRSGFSLIELVIAMAISAIIMLGMMEAYRNAITIGKNSRELLLVNRRVALLFNQMERDFSTVSVYLPDTPFEQKEEKAERLQLASERNKKEEKPLPVITTKINEDESFQLFGEKWQMTQFSSFLCFNALEVYGKKTPRYVRVGYTVEPDKKEGKKVVSYKLIRSETTDYKNAVFKQKEDAPEISRHTVITGIRHFSLRYTYRPLPPKEEGKDTPPLQNVFMWTEKEEKKAVNSMPEHVSIALFVWDGDLKRSYPFEVVIPLFIVPTEDTQKSSKDTAAKKTDQKTFDDHTALTQPEESGAHNKSAPLPFSAREMK